MEMEMEMEMIALSKENKAIICRGLTNHKILIRRLRWKRRLRLKLLVRSRRDKKIEGINRRKNRNN
jgi:hypothetical protein